MFAQAVRYLPALGVIAIKGILGKVLVPAAGVDILGLLHAGLLRVLLQIGDIMRSVPALEHGIGCRRLLLALPK